MALLSVELRNAVEELGLYLVILAFAAALWLPQLGSPAQQRLLGVGTGADVVSTVTDVILTVAACLGYRAVTAFRTWGGAPRRNECWSRPSAKTCFPECFA
jgi:hypothetical protein